MQTEIAAKNLRLHAWRAIDDVIAQGATGYNRARIACLIPIGPDEARDGAAATRGIVLRLARALRSERSRGRAGHWTYDLNRHVALAQAYRAEKQRWRQERAVRKSERGPQE